MDKITKALKEKYNQVVRRRYMSQIKGNNLKEFLLAIYLHNIFGEGEILEEDGTVIKLVFPMREDQLRDIILELIDNVDYLFIWNPISAEDNEIKTLQGSIEDPLLLELFSTHPEIALTLSEVKDLMESYMKEFELWGIVLTDIEGNPLVWSLSREKFSRCDKCQEFKIDENTILELVKLFVKSKLEIMKNIKTKALKLNESSDEVCDFGMILSFRTLAVRIKKLLDKYALVLVISREQLGFSKIVENKIDRELKALMSDNTEIGGGGGKYGYYNELSINFSNSLTFR